MGNSKGREMVRVTSYFHFVGHILYLNSDTVFSELQIATDTVQRERNKPSGACYQ